jgi:iron(III) transport system substrate-binding protein
MAMSGSISTASNFVGTLCLDSRRGFRAPPGAAEYPHLFRDGAGAANLMIAGEVALSPTIYNSHVEASAARCAAAWTRRAGAGHRHRVALARGAPSPHAAMLMIDYLMSQEGQRIYGRLGYGSARRDAISARHNPVQKLYLGNRPDYVREVSQWSKLYRDVFLRIDPSDGNVGNGCSRTICPSERSAC